MTYRPKILIYLCHSHNNNCRTSSAYKKSWRDTASSWPRMPSWTSLPLRDRVYSPMQRLKQWRRRKMRVSRSLVFMCCSLILSLLILSNLSFPSTFQFSLTLSPSLNSWCTDRRVNEQAKRLDHITRALRIEAPEAIAKKYQEQVEEDRAAFQVSE